MPCFVILVFLAAAAGVLYPISAWIFRPVDKAGKRLQLPTQFTIVDVLCLFFLIQMPMAFIHYGGYRDTVEQTFALWLLDGFVWIACGSMWLVSVRTLSRAGVTKQWHRAVFLTLVLPVSIVGAIGIPSLSIVVLGTLCFEPSGAEWWLAVAAAADLGLIVVVYLAGWFTRKMVAAAEKQEDATADAETQRVESWLDGIPGDSPGPKEK